MIRLVVLLLVTLAGLFLIMQKMGDGDLRAQRRVIAEPQPVAQDVRDQPGAAENVPALPPTAVVEVASQTPVQTQRFPGPALRPSPEHATPAPVADAGEGDAVMMYVTGDRVNMRAGPSTSDRVVAALSRGAVVERVGPVGADWINVRDDVGRNGFIAARLLSADAR